MTSINFHFRPSSKARYCEGKLFIRLIHKRKPKNLATDYKLFPHEWDEKDRKVLLPNDDRSRLIYLQDIQSRMSEDINRLRSVVKLLSRKGDYAVDEITAGVRIKDQDGTLWSFSESLGKKLIASGRERTARAYRTAAKSLILYNKGIDPELADIDEGLILRYEKHLKDHGRELNTISFYMRNIRAIYFKAIKARIIVQKFENPFINVYTGVCESRKRALDQNQITALSTLESNIGRNIKRLSEKSRTGNRPENDHLLAHYWDLQASLMYFMFSYHARGMSFVDVAYLKKTDIRDGRITYRRHKTGGRLSVRITEPMQKIIGKFADRVTGSDHVFPIIDPQRRSARIQYETGLRTQNKRLKVLGKMVGVENLSTHVARHTWATLAKKAMIDIQVISEALGHRDAKTTQRYLASFDQSTLDKASEQMSRLIKKAG